MTIVKHPPRICDKCGTMDCWNGRRFCYECLVEHLQEELRKQDDKLCSLRKEFDRQAGIAFEAGAVQEAKRYNHCIDILNRFFPEQKEKNRVNRE